MRHKQQYSTSWCGSPTAVVDKLSEIRRFSFNSSITRVRPVFQRLIRMDATGLSWLPSILGLASCSQSYARNLAKYQGTLLDWVVERHHFGDRVLKARGVSRLHLEGCFEYALAPPTDFLRWLIQNPGRMTWPDRGRMRFGATAQRLRDDLFGRNGPEASLQAQREALNELLRVGSERSRRRWWAFEGFTSADCYLETDKLVLLIEGKRFETVSSAVQWYPRRNQLVRNLEATCQAAGGKEFALLAIGEGAIEDLDQDALTTSLPHLTTGQGDDLRNHYLGYTTWAAVCEATGIDYSQLPKTVDDAMTELKGFGYITI